MLTDEEERFVTYWEAERLRKKTYLKRFSVVLPLLALVAVAFFVNFTSGWYDKADKELRRHSSLLVTILVAVIAIVVFVVIFGSRHRWDRAEADYQSLIKKRDTGAINKG